MTQDCPGDLTVKNLPTMREPQYMWVQSPGQEDPLEKDTATHSSFLAWRIAWTEEPGRLQSIGSQRVRHNWSILARHGTACDSKIMFSSTSSVPLYMQSKSKQQVGLFRILYKVQKYKKDKFSILDHSYLNRYIPTMFFKTKPLYLTLSNDNLRNLIILFPIFIVSKYFQYTCFNFKYFSLRNYWVWP